MRMYRIGIDLGGTNIAAGLVDETPRIVDKLSVPTNAPRPMADIAEDMAALVRALLEGNLRRAAGALCNGLECCAGLEAIPRLVGKMREMGALGSRMTGSGSAVFGVFAGEREALACRDALGEDAAFAALCRPVAAGWEIERG